MEKSDQYIDEDRNTIADVLPIERNTVIFPGFSTPSKSNIKSEKTIFSHNFYIETAWSPQTYFTYRGIENIQIYFWIAKDLSWTQHNPAPAFLFGSSTLFVCCILFIYSLLNKEWEDAYQIVPVTFWLTGNIVWMFGEVANDDDYIVAPQTAIFFEVAASLMALYHFVLRPLGYLQPDEKTIRQYELLGLKPRIPYLKTWRQYEQFHTVFWLGKDYCWLQVSSLGRSQFQSLWVFFLIPTILIAVDFIITSFHTKRMTIDLAHYVAQLIWVSANAVWAGAEIFADPYYLAEYDNGHYIFHISPAAQMSARWYSSWLCLFAYLPIVLLYAVWIPLTCMGRLEAADTPMNRSFVKRMSQSFSENHSVPDSKEWSQNPMVRESTGTDVDLKAITLANTLVNASTNQESIDEEAKYTNSE